MTQAWTFMVSELDIEGEQNAYTTLGLTPGPPAPSMSEVKRAYHAASRRWHPDKNPDKQQEAQARMVEINDAYETLKKIADRRKKGHRAGAGRHAARAA